MFVRIFLVLVLCALTAKSSVFADEQQNTVDPWTAFRVAEDKVPQEVRDHFSGLATNTKNLRTTDNTMGWLKVDWFSDTISCSPTTYSHSDYIPLGECVQGVGYSYYLKYLSHNYILGDYLYIRVESYHEATCTGSSYTFYYSFKASSTDCNSGKASVISNPEQKQDGVWFSTYNNKKDCRANEGPKTASALTFYSNGACGGFEDSDRRINGCSQHGIHTIVYSNKFGSSQCKGTGYLEVLTERVHSCKGRGSFTSNTVYGFMNAHCV